MAEDRRDPAFFSPREVARRLKWSEDTIRRHLTPLKKWKRGNGTIPCIKLGAREYVPAWWVREVLDAAKSPPE